MELPIKYKITHHRISLQATNELLESKEMQGTSSTKPKRNGRGF